MIPPLYEHQKEALRRLEKADKYALLMDMGTGKSRTIVEDWLRRDNFNLLVIAPKGVYRNWRGEIDQYTTPLQKKSIMIAHWVSGARKEEKRSIQNVLKNWHNIRRVFLMNIEALSTVKDAIQSVHDFIDSGPCMVVIDESTRIKSFNSKRTKNVLEIGAKAPVKRILSGLIAPRSPMDVFSQFQFLDWRILGFRNYYSFRSEHAILKKMVFGGRSVDTIVGYKNIEDLQNKIAPFSYRVLKDECLDLPPKIYTERSVDLSAEQEKAYLELKKNATTLLESGQHVTATIAISLMQRLHQITYGHVRDDLGNVTKIDASPRENELLNVLEECSGKTIIWACFRHTIQRIAELIIAEYGEESLVQFWGDTSSDEREVSKKRFQEDPKCRFFLGNPSTGGIGITLTAANQVVYYANSFDLEHRLQSEDRAHRAGLKHSVTYVDLVAKGTIDEKILNALRGKINVAASITGELAREWIR